MIKKPIAILIYLLLTVQLLPAAWITADSFNDPNGRWTTETNSYDSSTSTYASNTAQLNWASFIELNYSSPVYSDRFRVYSDFGYGAVDGVDVDVYDDDLGVWVDVYQGAITDAAWETHTFTARNISSIRFRYHYTSTAYLFWLYELQVWEATPIVTPSVETKAATSEDTNSAIVHGEVLDDGGEPGQYRFQYGETTAYGMSTTWEGNLISGDTFGKFLSGLTENVLYHYRVQLKNSAATVNGTDRYFTAKQPQTGWLAPTGYLDPDNNWDDEEKAFDDEDNSYARHYSNIGDPVWSSFIYFTHDAVSSNKVRYYARGNTGSGIYVDQCDLDLYLDGSWVNVYQGTLADKTWEEQSFATGSVTQARIRFRKSDDAGLYFEIYKFQFYKTLVDTTPNVTLNSVMEIAWVDDVELESGTSTYNCIIRRKLDDIYAGKLKLEGAVLGLDYTEDYTGIVVSKNSYGLPYLSVDTSTGSFGEHINNNPPKQVLIEFNLLADRHPLLSVDTGSGSRTISQWSGSEKSGLSAEYSSRYVSFNYDQALKKLTFKAERFTTYSVGVVSTVSFTETPITLNIGFTQTITINVVDTNDEGVEGAPVTVSILSGAGTLNYTLVTTNASGLAFVDFTASENTGTTIIEAYCDTVTSNTTCTVNAADLGLIDLSNWGDNRRIVLEEELVSGNSDFTDFPVLIKIVSADYLQTDTQSDFDDVVFVSSTSANVSLAHEIEYYNRLSGDLYAWVKIPVLDHDDDTIIYMFFDNPTCSDQRSTADVWTKDFLAVWHLGDGGGKDSSPFGNDLTNFNNTPTADGYVGYCHDFNGTNHYFYDANGDAYINGLTEFTISMWVRSDILGVDNGIFRTVTDIGTDEVLSIRYDAVGANSNAQQVIKTGLLGNDPANQIETSEYSQSTYWKYLMYSWQSGSRPGCYINGQVDVPSDQANVLSGTISNADALWIGNGPKVHWDGELDEVRVVSVNRSAEWIETEYNNMKYPLQFIRIGFGSEPVPPTPTITSTLLSPTTQMTITVSGNRAFDTSKINVIVEGATVGPVSYPDELSWRTTVTFNAYDYYQISVNAENALGIGSGWTVTTTYYDNGAPAAPVITTNSGVDFSTENASILLEGTCSTESEQILINGSDIGVNFVSGNTSWSATLGLNAGVNTINVKAIDYVGYESAVDTIYITLTSNTLLVIYPNAIGPNDNTADTLADILADDAAIAPPGSVTNGDNVYTVLRNSTMEIGGFDVSSIPAGSILTSLILHLQYGTQNGYNGTNSLQWRLQGGTYANTAVTPADTGGGWSTDQTDNLFSRGVTNSTQLSTLDISFANNDGPPPDDLSFDYLWCTITYLPQPTIPAIFAVDSPTNNDTQLIRGTKDQYTSTINLVCSGATVGTMQYPTLGSWQVTINNLQEGLNRITVNALNDAGIAGPVTTSIIVDTLPPPTPSITNNGGNDFTTENAAITLQGSCGSDSQRIEVNGSTSGVSYTPGSTSWSAVVGLNIGGNYFEVQAFDIGDNSSGIAAINITLNATNIIQVYPVSIGAADNTTDLLSDIVSDDASVLPTGSVTTSDGIYTVLQNNTMEIDQFDLSALPTGAVLTDVYLHTQYGTEDSFGANNFLEWKKESGSYSNTDIQPINSDYTWTADFSYDLYAQGVTNSADVASLNIRYINNDPNSAQAISFDYLWLTLIFETPPDVPVIFSPDTPTNNDAQLLQGTKDSDVTTINVQCTSASVGAVSYPTLGTWQVMLTNLSEGNNPITVNAQNSVGYSSDVTENIYIDTIDPATPNITSPNSGNDFTTENASFVLEGTCSADVQSILVNGSTLGVSYTPGDTSWTYLAGLNLGLNIYQVTAVDLVGNTSGADSISVTYNAPNVIMIYPNSQTVNDNTGDLLSDVTSDDAAITPPGAVTQGDNVYSVDRNDRLEFGSFDTGAIPDGSVITDLILHIQYGTENGYSGTNAIEWRYDAGVWSNTSIVPINTAGSWGSDVNDDMFANGVTNSTQLAALDIGFTNNDSPPNSIISFDYLWMTLTYIPLPTTPTILPVDSPTINDTQLISGSKDQFTTTINVQCDSATVGSVSYPTLGTWQVLLSNLTPGDNPITVNGTNIAGTSGTATTSIIVDPGTGITITKDFTINAPADYLALGGAVSDPVPGALITITNTFRNDGYFPATTISLVDVIPTATTYEVGTATASVTANITFQHTSGGPFDSSETLPITAIKWLLSNDLAVSQQEIVSFNVTID